MGLIRNLLRKGDARRPVPVGTAPGKGAYIFKGDVRVRVDVPLSQEVWQFLTLMGWREVMHKPDRRKYFDADPTAFMRFVRASANQREMAYMGMLRTVKGMKH